jgi:biotin synthase
MEKKSNLLGKDFFTKAEIVEMLNSEGNAFIQLLASANNVRIRHVGPKVYFRGLVEFSNICSKDCYYCGIRKSNTNVQRYNLSDDEIMQAARFAYENNYGSLVLQSGETVSDRFTNRIENLLRQIKQLSDSKLGITLSVGEQTYDVYKRWFDAGAHRYLLRIETSNQQLYRRLHPDDHYFENRLQCLKNLQHIGYQTGTGVMIGLPYQTVEDLAGDLLFVQQFDSDMVGMGPYIEHAETPLYAHKHVLWPVEKRFTMALKMIAVLRIMMKDINIASATALQAIDPLGREKGVKAGANVIMPNITPGMYRNNYSLYQNKPCTDEEPEQCNGCLDARLALADSEIGYGEWGDSKHYFRRMKK